MTEQQAKTPVALHWQELLTPISTARPSGESLRYAGDYDRIREARREDDPNLPQGEWISALKRAEWPEVEKLCLEALTQRSKDLQIAIWLLEAELHLHAYQGLRDGLLIVLALCENFWDTLWPELEENDAELRVSPLIWMNEKLSVPLTLKLPLTAPSDPDLRVYNYFDLQQALKLEANPELKDQIDVTYARFMRSADTTPQSFFQVTEAVLDEALSALNNLNQFLNERCGRQAPSLNRFSETLRHIHRSVNNLLKEKPVTDETAPGASSGNRDNPETDGETLDEASTGNGVIRSRAEAYRQLSEAADYLMRTEPHSPTPYLVKRAVSWGRLSLGELLQELVNDDHDLQAIYTLLGMNRGEGR